MVLKTLSFIFIGIISSSCMNTSGGNSSSNGSSSTVSNGNNSPQTSVGVGVSLSLTVAPKIQSFQIQNSSPSMTRRFQLDIESNGTRDEYCLLENDSDINNCIWKSLPLPSEYEVSEVNNLKTLSLWLRNNKKQISDEAISNSVLLDTIPPAIPNGLSLLSPLSSPNDSRTPVVRVEGVISGDSVELYADVNCSGALMGSAIASGASVQIISAQLFYGSHRFYAKTKDSIGNESACSSAFTDYIVTIPAPASFTRINPLTTSGDVTTPEFQVGGVYDVFTVSLFSDSSCTQKVATGMPSGGSVNLVSRNLGLGTYNFHAKQFEANGASSECSTTSITYETLRAGPPQITNMSLVSPAEPFSMTDSQPEIFLDGTVNGMTVGLFTDANCTNLYDSKVATGSTTNIQVSPLSPGKFTFYASQEDDAGNWADCSVVKLNYAYDTTPPIVSFFELNNGDDISFNNNVVVAMQANDTETNITHFCFKYNDNVQPLADDRCWEEVNSPTPGITPAHNFAMTSGHDFYFTLGFVKAFYDVYAWAKNEVEGISALTNSGAGTSGVDYMEILYDPGIPPTVLNVAGTTNPAGIYPPIDGELVANAGDDIYIVWHATDDKPLPSNPVELFYTVDGENYIPIASNLLNDVNGDCSLTADATGCYKWQGGAPSGQYFRIRVKVTDEHKITTQLLSVPFNISSVRFLAGNLENGIGGSAISAPINVDSVGSMVVTRKGVIYYKHKDRGLYRIDPSQGANIELIVPATGVSSGDGGPFEDATLHTPLKIALDFTGRLLIFDYDRIRRVDLNEAPYEIETIAGGGVQTGDDILPKSVQIIPPDSAAGHHGRMPLFVLPNGDIYFQSEGYYLTRPDAGYRLRYIDHVTGLVKSIYPGGTGDFHINSQDMTKCPQYGWGANISPDTFEIEEYYSYSLHNTADSDCVMISVLAGWVTGLVRYGTDGNAVRPADLGIKEQNRYVQGMDLKLYTVRTDAAPSLKRYDRDADSFPTIVGSGTRGSCLDGTAATACNTVMQDAFITERGLIYFIDDGKIRIIDRNGDVFTLYGVNRSSGESVSALSARLGTTYNVGIWDNAGDLTFNFYDRIGFKVREFSELGSIETLAGNGTWGIPTKGVLAKNTTLQMQYQYGLTQTTGDGSFYMTQGAEVLKLNRTSQMWEAAIGGGSTGYQSADGEVGTDVKLPIYQVPIGLKGDSTLAVAITNVILTTTVPVPTDAMIKGYDLSNNNTQSHIAGISGTAGQNYCGNGITRSTCAVPAADVGGINYTTSFYDAIEAGWLVHKPNTTKLVLLPDLALAGKSTYATLPRSFVGWDYYHPDGSTKMLYYCSTAGQLFSYDLINSQEELLDISDVYNISCYGNTVKYMPSRNSVVFTFQEGIRYGVAEYLLP